MATRSRHLHSRDGRQSRPPEQGGDMIEEHAVSSTATALDSDAEHADRDDLTPAQRLSGDRLRRDLIFFFMNPMQKWRVRKQLPFKLALQVIKIVIVTAQLTMFAQLRMNHVAFMENTNTVLRHKFLPDWDSVRDVVVYPPAIGAYSAFTTKDLYDTIASVIYNYYNLDDSFVSYSYDTRKGHMESEITPIKDIPPLQMCINRIKSAEVVNNTYVFDTTVVQNCHLLNFTEKEVDDIKQNASGAVPLLLQHRNITFNALQLTDIGIKFNLRTIHFGHMAPDAKPECYRIAVRVNYDNSGHTGQVMISLSSEISYVEKCNGKLVVEATTSVENIIMGLIDIFVLLTCLSSLILCCRAVIRAQFLKQSCEEYFEDVMKAPLSLSDRLEFLNLWYVMIVINDCLIIIGTICKVSIEFRDFDNSLFTTTGLMLGCGTLLVYIGVLRYFGFFSQYNVLVLTLKKSLPNMLRFMTCAAVIYGGFLFAGWVIIGPYSLKFRTLSTASEALFSLLNGDDMFATFFTINDNNYTIKVFGTIYIYIFVSLFIYVVISLFIAIIMDAYEIIKDRYDHGYQDEKSPLRDFVKEVEMVSEYPPDYLVQLADCSTCWPFFRRLRERYTTTASYGHMVDEEPVTDNSVIT